MLLLGFVGIFILFWKIKEKRKKKKKVVPLFQPKINCLTVDKGIDQILE